jgi:alcohol dehydrogenase
LCRNAELLGESRHGTYAEYVLFARFVHLFRGVDPRVAVVAIYPLSTAVYVLRHVDVDGKRVLVVGAGGGRWSLHSVACRCEGWGGVCLCEVA